jgi:hypothetical protein
MEVLQVSDSKRRLNSSSRRSAKLRSRSVDNSQRRSAGKLRLSSSCNFRIINKRNNSLSSSRSIDNSRRSPGKLRLSHSCNMRISNRRSSILSNSRRSTGNHPLSSRCSKYGSLCNRWSPGNLLTQNVHLAPNTQQAEQAGFTRAKSHETCQSFFPEN